MKKILSLVLALVMALSLTTVAWGATPAEEAQAALDNAAVGTTIQLQSGVNYGTLLVRPVVGAAHTQEGNWHAGGWTHELARTIENVTILGAAGAKVDAIKFDTGYKGDTYGTEVNDLYTYVTIKNLVIDGVEFTGNGQDTGYGYTSSIFVDLYNTDLDGLTVKNCKISAAKDHNFIYIVDEGEASTFATASKNVTITGNAVENVERLCELRGTENVTITGNTIKNTYEHAMLLAGAGYSGNVTITGNTADGNNDRFVRMAGADGATVTVSGNTVTNYLGSDADYIKVTKTDNTNITTQVSSNNILGYTVSFEANGGSGTMADVPVETNTEYTLPTCTFTAPANKQFKAWSVNGTEKAVGEKITITADMEIAAVWETSPVYYPVYVPTVEDTTEKDVTSAQTFDAGIALYVGVSVMGAVGTVALSKKRED